MYILEVCGYYDFEDTQVGFVQGSGTNMARGRRCILVPYPSEFYFIKQTMHYLMALGVCYTPGIMIHMFLRNPINVTKGTRQGLSSPIVFNIFYQDMVYDLTVTVGGICIQGISYNVFCYTDI